MPNRLAHETSPYLLQHQDNPVDWYPWGEEAFERARAENKPIFLSIGYSACHWCHVMAHESFEDVTTAALLNQHFVSIKVDREERPDIDSIYMSAVQAITGSGGWPMSVFLLPDGRPFYGGTYYPNAPRHGMPSFSQVLDQVARLYAENSDGVIRNASTLTEAIGHSVSLLDTSSDLPGDQAFEIAFQGIANQYDAQNGGFSRQPKFPPSMTLELLLRMYARFGWKQALTMVTHTLDRMAAGGLYDQLGGGFHRYSTDAIWLVPHFEKMLYDNALLIRVYLNAYLVTGSASYRAVVENTVAYLKREMTSPEGGFYSSQDADSEGHEGKYFIWSADEINKALSGHPHLEAVVDYWGISAGPNFEGKNILWVPKDAAEIAAKHSLKVGDLLAAVKEASQTLLDIRERRVKPGTDTKILTAWNGLMIGSLAQAGRALNRAEFTRLAADAAEFVLAKLVLDGRLLRSYRDGQAKHSAFLEDYACLVSGLAALYQTTFDVRWYDEAVALCDRMMTLFWDDESGFYDTAHDHETLIARPQELTDNAMPSGTSAAVESLLSLGILAERRDWRDKAERVLARLGSAIQGYPTAFSHLACQLDFRLGKPHEIALVGEPDAADTRALLEVIRKSYLPNSVMALARPDSGDVDRVALLKDKTLIGGKAAAYVCHNSVCRMPATSPDALRSELGLADSS